MPDPLALLLAATVLPVRDRNGEMEVLMVRRNPNLSFGGMWTFPGGRLEASDGPLPDAIEETTQDWGAADLLETARQGGRRETAEETAVGLDDNLMWISHWIPPVVGAPKRFATWFFVSKAGVDPVVLDESENDQYQWLKARDALSAHDSDDLPMAPPTWVTLDDMAAYDSVESFFGARNSQAANLYHTRAYRTADDGRMLCWLGDAAYETGALDAPGPRNRLLVSSTFAIVRRERDEQLG